MSWMDELLLLGYHSVHPPPPRRPFILGGLQDLNLERGLLGKLGGGFFQEGYSFYINNKLKSEIFNNKKII